MFNKIFKLELQSMDLNFDLLWPMIEELLAEIDFSDDPEKEESNWLDKLAMWKYNLERKVPICLDRFQNESVKCWLDRCYLVSNYGRI